MDHVIPNEILFPQVASLLREGKTVTLTPRGRSMLPYIRGGVDSVSLHRQETYRVGDVVLAQLLTPRGTTYVLHRLIRVDGEEVTLRGDGNIRGEEHCLMGDIIGAVTAVYWPSGRRKHATRARLWQLLYPIRRYLLKAYRVSCRSLGIPFDKN